MKSRVGIRWGMKAIRRSNVFSAFCIAFTCLEPIHKIAGSFTILGTFEPDIEVGADANMCRSVHNPTRLPPVPLPVEIDMAVRDARGHHIGTDCRQIGLMKIAAKKIIKVHHNATEQFHVRGCYGGVSCNAYRKPAILNPC